MTAPAKLMDSSARADQIPLDSESLRGFRGIPYPGSKAEALFKINGTITLFARIRKSLPSFDIPAPVPGAGGGAGKAFSGARNRQTGAFLIIAVPLNYFFSGRKTSLKIAMILVAR